MLYKGFSLIDLVQDLLAIDKHIHQEVALRSTLGLKSPQKKPEHQQDVRQDPKERTKRNLFACISDYFRHAVQCLLGFGA